MRLLRRRPVPCRAPQGSGGTPAQAALHCPWQVWIGIGLAVMFVGSGSLGFGWQVAVSGKWTGRLRKSGGLERLTGSGRGGACPRRVPQAGSAVPQWVPRSGSTARAAEGPKPGNKTTKRWPRFWTGAQASGPGKGARAPPVPQRVARRRLRQELGRGKARLKVLLPRRKSWSWRRTRRRTLGTRRPKKEHRPLPLQTYGGDSISRCSRHTTAPAPTSLPQALDAEVPACEGLRVYVLNMTALSVADGLPSCSLDGVVVAPSSGTPYLESTETGSLANASHVFGRYAGPWYLRQAILNSAYYTDDVHDADFILVDDYCYFVTWLAALESVGAKWEGSRKGRAGTNPGVRGTVPDISVAALQGGGLCLLPPAPGHRGGDDPPVLQPHGL
eukprot:jgi/Botrbrau1/19052/Bobra.0100s0076.1